MWGGVILHELGMPFLSPTVNLFILPDDYLRMLGDLRRYLCDEFLTQDIEESEKVGYPVGLLGDVRLWFVHYASFEEASKKWKERCAKVRWDHLYIIMVERDGCTEDNIREFDQLPYKHKVIFTAKEHPDIKSAYCIPGSSEENGQVMDLCRYRGILTGRRWIDMFDYVGFLNKG